MVHDGLEREILMVAAGRDARYCLHVVITGVTDVIVAVIDLTTPLRHSSLDHLHYLHNTHQFDINT